MAVKSFKCALPCAKRAFFLKKRIDRSLFQSIMDIHGAASSEGWISPFNVKYQNIVPPFCYTIYEELLKSCDAEQQEQIIFYLTEFEKIINSRPPHVLNYMHDSIPKWLWSRVHDIAFREVPEGGSLHECSESLFNEGHNNILKAESKMKEFLPNYYGEHKALVNNIIVASSERFIAGSSFDLQGAIMLKIHENQPTEDVIDLIIHETAHQHLFLLSTMDSLCLNDPDALYKSPLRQDPRPAVGNFHAIFVLYRLVDSLTKLMESLDLNGLNGDLLSKKIDDYKEKLEACIPAFMEHSILTALGRGIMRSISSF